MSRLSISNSDDVSRTDAAPYRFLREVALRGVQVATLAAVCLLPYGALLWFAGEAPAPMRIAASPAGPLLWSSKYYDFGIHKTAIAMLRRPRVAIVGSSRVMQFRARAFSNVPSADVYNLGGDTRDMVDAYSDLLRLTTWSRPELIILGLDWWWFRGTDPVPDDVVATIERGETSFEQRVNLPASVALSRARDYRTYVSDRLTIFKTAWRDADFWRSTGQQWRRDDGISRYGIPSVLRDSGFRGDGSYQYSLNQPHLARDLAFQEQRERFLAGGLWYADSTGVSHVQMKSLYRYLERCRRLGIEVVALLPPVASPVLNAIRNDSPRRQLLPQVAAQLPPMFEHFGFPLLDYSDAAVVGATDDDFYDGIHGTEKLYSRLLLHLATGTAAASVLRKYVDPAVLSNELQAAISWDRVYAN